MAGRLLLLAVVAFAVGYVGTSALESGGGPRLGPVRGDVLPSAPVRLAGEPVDQDLVSVLVSDSACSLVVLISTQCGVCRRMRESWPQRAAIWSDSVGAPVTLLWLSGESEDALAAFYAGYDFGNTLHARVAVEPQQALGRLGLFGTPTTYLLDRAGRLRQGLMGDRLPTVEFARNHCS